MNPSKRHGSRRPAAPVPGPPPEALLPRPVQSLPETHAAEHLAVLFADISGSTLLYRTRGDAIGFKLVSTCLDLLEHEVVRFGGRLIKRIGDAVLAGFAGSECTAAAIRAAAGMQRALEVPDCPLRGEGVTVRLGISAGTAVLDRGDVYGDVVNVAARLVALAGAEEVLISGEAYALLSPDWCARTRLIGTRALRGRPTLVDVYQYVWRDEDSALTPIVHREAEPGARLPPALEIRYGTQVFALGHEREKLRIGRDADNDVVIDDPTVSRRHADVVLRQDRFFLVDHSTNGTSVSTEAGAVIRLSREELPLAGSGRIVPGEWTIAPVCYRVLSRRVSV
jgi:adenylate cyclase